MIRRFAIVLVLGIWAWSSSSPFAHGLPAGAGRLRWSDEFDGTSLDLTKWTPSVGARRDATYTPQALTVDNGILTINTFTEGGTHYTGWVDTQNKYQPTYGYFEARVSFNTTPGMWSTFWLQTPDWPNPVIGNPAVSGTEIDVIEHRAVKDNGVDYRGRIHMAVHWDGYEAYHKSKSSSQNKAANGMGNGSWHTYGLLWEPDRYTFFFDDQPVWSFTKAVSQRPEFLLLSSEVQNYSWAGVIPAGGYGPLATTATNMQIDHVRVYSLNPEPSSLVLALFGVLWAMSARGGKRMH